MDLRLARRTWSTARGFMRRPGAKVMEACTCLSTRSRRQAWCVMPSIKQRAEVKSTMDALVGRKPGVRHIALAKMFTRGEGAEHIDDRETHSNTDPPPQRNVLGALPGALALSDPVPRSPHQPPATTPAGGREHRQMLALTCEARRHYQREHLSPPASLSPSPLHSVGQAFVRNFFVLFSPRMLKSVQVPLMFTTSGLN